MIFPVNEHTLVSTVRKCSWEHQNSVPKSSENYQFNCSLEVLSFILGKTARKRGIYPVWSCPEWIFTRHHWVHELHKRFQGKRYSDCRDFCLSLLLTFKCMVLGTDRTSILIWLEENSIKHYFMACRIHTEERAHMNVKYISLEWFL